MSAADDGPEITYVEAGEVVPFSGDLFPPAQSLRMGLELETCMERASVQLEHARRIFEISITSIKETARVELESEQARHAITKRELDAVDVWYLSPAFVATAAVVLTLAVGATMGYIWGQLTP